MPRALRAKESPPVETTVVKIEESLKWHPSVQMTRSAYRGGTLDYKYSTLVAKPDHSHMWLTVTRGCLDRALSVLNQLVWMLERNGFMLVPPEKGETRIKLAYVATKTELAFFLKEESERYERELTPEEKSRSYIYDQWKYRATGRLRLVVSEFHPEGVRKSWGDGKNTKLEDKLADAVSDFVICAQGKHVQELEWAARQRRWDEEARLRREAEELKRKEDERRAILFTAAKNWSEAGALKAFREACAARLQSTASGGTLTPLQENWLRWVDQVIKDTDPLTAGFLRRLEQSESSAPAAGNQTEK